MVKNIKELNIDECKKVLDVMDICNEERVVMNTNM